MNRKEMLREIARLHAEHGKKYAEVVPYNPAHENPHDGQTTDLPLWHVDRSAPPEIADELNLKIMALIAQLDPDPEPESESQAKSVVERDLEAALAIEDPPTRTAAVEEISKHLPGKHDQSTHGGGGSARESSAAPAGAGSGAAGSGRVGKKMARQPKVDNPQDIQAQAKAANPKYLSSPYTGPITPEIEAAGGVSYAHNCTRVVMAYEMRRRGMDVTAGAATMKPDHAGAYIRAFRQDGKYAVRIERDLSRNMSAKEVAAEARGWPVGARGIVVMQGHTVNIERTESGVRFVDAQAGSRRPAVMTPGQFAARAQSRGASTEEHMAVTRVDDLDMSDYSLRYVESSALDIADGQVGPTRYPRVPGSDRFPTDADLLAMTPDDSYP